MENKQTLTDRYSGREELTAMQAMRMADTAHAEGRTNDATRLIELGYHMLSHGVGLDELRTCSPHLSHIMRETPR